MIWLCGQGKYVEAIPIAERYVALARQKHGDDRTEYATTIGWLAQAYQAQGRYAEAEPLYKRALAIDKKALDPDHPSIATDLSSLAALYVSQGRIVETEKGGICQGGRQGYGSPCGARTCRTGESGKKDVRESAMVQASEDR